jgi:hypothetical protein
MAEMMQAQKDCHTAQGAVRNDSNNNISGLFKNVQMQGHRVLEE